MQQRTRLDHDRPCLACGAPWAWVEQTVEAAETDSPLEWVRVRGDCSARCLQTGKVTLEQANAALEERRLRGWSQ